MGITWGFAEAVLNSINKGPILEGWSNDRKYCFTNEKGERFLLRVSDIEHYDAKQSEFVMMQHVTSLDDHIYMPPLEITIY